MQEEFKKDYERVEKITAEVEKITNYVLENEK